MATTLQLERIAALVEKLDPIANKQRGMRIEADEWNALVDILRGILQIDRAQEDGQQVSLEQRFAAIDHEHIGQVNITWLDADLQARLGGQAGQGSVFTRTALGEATQKITSLGTEVSRLSSLAEKQQTLLDRTTVDLVDRSKVLQQFDQRFSGLENLRTLVSAVSNDVQGLRGNVDTVLKLRETLSDVAGNPIDVAGLKTQVAELETLRENLKGVDGNLLRLRDIEVKLNEVSDSAGTGNGNGLDQRIAVATAQLEERLNGRADQRDSALQQGFADGINASEGRLRGEFNTSIDSRAQALEQILTTRIGDSETRVNVGIDARIAASAEAVSRSASDSATVLIDQRLAGLPEQIRSSTSALIGSLRTELAAQISADIGTTLDTRFSGLQVEIGNRVGALEGRVADFETRIPGLVAGVVSDNLASLRGELVANINDQIGANLDRLRGDLQNSVGEQVREGLAGSLRELDAGIDNRIDARLSGLEELVTKSVANATRELPGQISAEIKTQIDALKLNEQVRSLNSELATQLRAEQTQVLAEQQARNSAAITNSVTLLRGEISATRTDLTNAINTRDTRLVTPVINPLTPVQPVR
jgi:hypothetical protein